MKRLNLINLYRLASLPCSLWNLTTLESLSIWGCYGIIQMSTDGFSALTKLKDMTIESITSQIPDSVQGLPHLETLCLRTEGLPSWGKITFPAIHGLSSLKRLSTRRTLPKKCPIPPYQVSPSPTLSTLQHLEHLDLRSVTMGGVPEFLGRIPGLRSLILVCDFITGLPPGFPVLETLSLKILRDPEDLNALSQTETPHHGPIPPGSYPSLKHLNATGWFSSHEIVVSPAWNLRLDVRRVKRWEAVTCPGGCVDVKELVVRCTGFQVMDVPHRQAQSSEGSAF